MKGKSQYGRLASIIFRCGFFASTIWMLCAFPGFAQVQIEYTGQELVIRNAGHAPQRAVRSFGKMNDGWAVEDGVGNSYQAACRETCSQNTDGTWYCTGFESSDGVDADIIKGYDDALQYLVDEYGAVVEHDPVADLDFVTFPDAEDPYELLATVLLNDYLNGRLLVEYFKSIELSSLGVTGGKYEAGKPRGKQLAFPNDPYFTSQWNLHETNLLLAQLLPLSSRRKQPVKIAILDSGINQGDSRHYGLDGVGNIDHLWTAPATGFSDQHGLAVATLLADQGNDGDGPVGLVGSVNGSCEDYQTAFSQKPVEILSYSVGAWGPMSNFVIRALHQAVKVDGADVILMNFRMGYSPNVEAAIADAVKRGMIVVAAAGNYHAAHRTKPVGFPASVDGVVSVGSARSGKNVSDFSARGSDILAPGEKIAVGVPGNGWVYAAGTSFAAPHVAAAAALLKLVSPRITSTEFEGLIKESASSLGRKDQEEGFLDALAAVGLALQKEKPYRSDVDFDWDDLTECEVGKAGQSLAAHETPTEVELLGNYPNPFNPETKISFTAPGIGEALFSVYDVLGRRIYDVDIDVQAGRNDVSFSGRDLTSGSYFYRIKGEGLDLSGRMLLLK